MNFREAIVIASRGLEANKLRAVLTTLGIIIGVAAVIMLVGLGNGIKAGFNDSFGKLANQLTVSKVTGSTLGGQIQNLTDRDVTALRDRSKAPAVASVTPTVTGSAVATYNQLKFQASVLGSTPDYLEITDRDLAVGNMFTAAQARSNAKVVVLGANSVVSLFGGNAGDAMGKEVRLGNSTFTVIGVLATNGQNDDAVVVPLGTARAYLTGGTDEVNQIIVKATSPQAVRAAQDQITSVLDARHSIHDPEKRDFKVNVMQNQLDRMTETLGFLTIFTVAIACISLIVGGIGVANIMLVSVTERTREIGIRKAIGARRSAIMKQFLIESTVLSGLGGMVGMAVGVGMTLVAAQIIPQLSPRFGTPTVSWTAVGISFLFSLVIGVVAGGYPALRASTLRPIEALRFQ
ncbi:ABC transporter permease [Pseudonocardia eucalypti]|uniref:ABC transporter permease n=1 Tax=Pseudonocardia eucalypti TaxID=648755 RepID=A0ABP9Q2H9_9PSEU|nr:putative ABC transport system permease protein [Pseudonocardia eucalypti]